MCALQVMVYTCAIQIGNGVCVGVCGVGNGVCDIHVGNH